MNTYPMLQASFLALATAIGACSPEAPMDPETRKTCEALQEQFRNDLERVYVHSREANCSPKIGNAYYVLNSTQRQYAGKCRQAPGLTHNQAMFTAVKEDLTRRGCISGTP